MAGLLLSSCKLVFKYALMELLHIILVIHVFRRAQMGNMEIFIQKYVPYNAYTITRNIVIIQQINVLLSVLVIL